MTDISLFSHFDTAMHIITVLGAICIPFLLPVNYQKIFHALQKWRGGMRNDRERASD